MKKLAWHLVAVSLMGFFCSFTPSIKTSDSYMVDWECPCKNKKKKPENGSAPAPKPVPVSKPSPNVPPSS